MKVFSYERLKELDEILDSIQEGFNFLDRQEKFLEDWYYMRVGKKRTELRLKIIDRRCILKEQLREVYKEFDEEYLLDDF